MPNYKLDTDTELSRKPADFLKEKNDAKDSERNEWRRGRSAERTQFSAEYERLSEAWAKRYTSGSVLMALVGCLMLLDRFLNREQLFSSDRAGLPLLCQLGLVAVVLGLAFLDLIPYKTKTFKENKASSAACRIVYWVSVALVVFSFARGAEMRILIEGLIVLGGCAVLLWVNWRQRHYVPRRSSFGKVMLPMTRIIVLLLQLIVIFDYEFYKNLIDMII